MDASSTRIGLDPYGIRRDSSSPRLGLGWLGRLGRAPQGSIARGYGALAAGVGYGNLQNAEARSINYDTWQRWNQYLYLSNEEATRKYIAKKNYDIAKNKESVDKIIKRLQDNPTSRDVDDGDALNAARPAQRSSDPGLFTGPPLRRSLPRSSPISRSNRLRRRDDHPQQSQGRDQWPACLDVARFADDKKNFEEIAAQARKEDEDGEISPDTITCANDLIANVTAKLNNTPLADSRDNMAAQRFLRTLTGLVRLMKKPDTQQVLDQLRMVTNTTVGSLIGFMHVYNLRFGAATTPQQKGIYEQLYPVLDQVRDQVLKAADLDAAEPFRPILNTSETSSTSWTSTNLTASRIKPLRNHPLHRSELGLLLRFDRRRPCTS